MNLVVQTASVTHHGVALLDPPPEGGLAGAAVVAGGVSPLLQTAHLAGLPGLHQRPVGAVHLVVETAGVTEIVPTCVSPPERSGGDSAVDTLPAAGHGGRGGGGGGRGGCVGGGSGEGWWRRGVIAVASPVVVGLVVLAVHAGHV